MSDSTYVGYSRFFKDFLTDEQIEKISKAFPDARFKDISVSVPDTDISNTTNNTINDSSSIGSNTYSKGDFTFTEPSDRKGKKEKGKGTLKSEIINYINSLEIEDDYKKYLIKLAERESGFNPDAANIQGYKGLFQMGKTALKDVGMNEEDYISDWKNQVDAVIKFTNKNLEQLQSTIDAISGRKVNNTPINKWGLLGAAHLGGVGGIKKYLMSGVDRKDANNTSISEYLHYFNTI